MRWQISPSWVGLVMAVPVALVVWVPLAATGFGWPVRDLMTLAAGLIWAAAISWNPKWLAEAIKWIISLGPFVD